MSGSYTSVRTSEELARFLHEVDSFHDAIMRCAILSSPARIDNLGRLFNMDEPSTGRVIFHSQFEDIGIVDVIFRGLEAFSIDTGTDLKASGEVRNERVRLRLTATGDYRIVCSCFQYRIHGRINELADAPWAMFSIPSE